MGSPVSVTNRPLAEQLADRAAELEALERAPNAIAFTDTWESGTFLRLDVASGMHPLLRSGPGENFAEVAPLEPGSEVLATGNQTGEWIHVLYSAFEGWIHVDHIDIAIERTAPPLEESRRETITYIIASEYGGLNVRSGPGTQHELLLGTSNGDEVAGTGNSDGGWVEVIVDGTTGWVAGRHVRLLDGTSPVPTAPPRRAPATTEAPATTTPEEGEVVVEGDGGAELIEEQAPAEAPATTEVAQTTTAPAPTDAPTATAPAESAPAEGE